MPTIPKYSAEHAALRDTLVADAVKAGKILPSRTQYWQQQFDANPEGTKAVLAQLTPVPGIAATSGASAPADPTQYDQSWLTPSERARVTNAQSGQRPVIDRTND